MNSSAPRRRAETALEYALFAAILIMTVVGTFLYKAIVHDPLLAGFTKYLIVVYLVFLALAFGQLNCLHRKRVLIGPSIANARLTLANRTVTVSERLSGNGSGSRIVLEQTRNCI
jgi:hypothetical protein